jgi:hypothetical protein
MTMFLLAARERDAKREKSRFPLVNRVFFETKGNVLKIDDFAILSLAGLPISRSWQHSRLMLKPAR